MAEYKLIATANVSEATVYTLGISFLLRSKQMTPPKKDRAAIIKQIIVLTCEAINKANKYVKPTKAKGFFNYIPLFT